MTTAPEFGWRFGGGRRHPAVLLLIRIARRMFRSTVLGCAAGLLMALDGFHLVLSRTALLDIFLLFFVLAAFGALVLDRDARRRRWLRALEDGLDPTGPGRAGRPAVGWRCRGGGWPPGCCSAAPARSSGARSTSCRSSRCWCCSGRSAPAARRGVRRPWRDTLLDECRWLVARRRADGRHLPGHLVGLVAHRRRLLPARSPYPSCPAQRAAGDRRRCINLFALPPRRRTSFHTTLDDAHTYQSWPWQWLLLGRPVAFYWSGDGACGAPTCASEILLLGTPLLWWSFLPALAALAWLGVARRDWRAGGDPARRRRPASAALVLVRPRRPDDVLLLRRAGRAVPGAGRGVRAGRADRARRG